VSINNITHDIRIKKNVESWKIIFCLVITEDNET
jgi:hypothetical protein